jgi:hypothetical protein
MADELKINVLEIVGNPLCVASDDGQKVCDAIAKALKEKRGVEVSFHNVKSLTSAFLNAAIGQLYGMFTPETIRGLVRVADMEKDDLGLLKRVVDTAKEYFKDPKRFQRAVNDVMGKPADA